MEDVTFRPLVEMGSLNPYQLVDVIEFARGLSGQTKGPGGSGPFRLMRCEGLG